MRYHKATTSKEQRMKQTAILLFVIVLSSIAKPTHNPNHYYIKYAKKEGKLFLKNAKTGMKRAFHLKLNSIIPMPKAAKKTTKKGIKRDRRLFWQKYKQKFLHHLSAKNLLRIKKGKSPVVDKKWIQYHRDHKPFRGQTIEHHHLGHGKFAVPLPMGLHRLKKNFSFWHKR